MDASAYNYGANPSTAFTINQSVCSPTPIINMFNGGPYCEGQNALFFILADADFSYSVTNPVGNVVHTGSGNSVFVISPTTISDSGLFTLSGCNTNGCYAEWFDYLTVNSLPFVEYDYIRSSTSDITPDGYIEIGIGGGDGSYSISDGGLFSTFGTPAQFNGVPSGYTGFFSISDGNLCGTGLNVNAGGCSFGLPIINFTSNTYSIGSDLILSAYGGTTYRYYRIQPGSTPVYDVTVSGDPITGSTVTVTNNYQISDSGTYVVQVVDSSGCTDYATIVIT